MSVESRLTVVEESLRLLRDADRLQGRPFSAAAPSAGAVVVWNATTKKFEPASGVTIIDRDLATVEIVNDADEETIYSHSIPADTLGVTGGIRVTMAGDYLNDTGGDRTLVIKVKLGATTLLTTTAFTSTASAERRKWFLTIWLMNTATNAQRCSAQLIWSRATSDTFPMLSVDATTGTSLGAGYGTAAEDTTGALTFLVSSDHSGTASASLSMRKQMAIMELMSEV